MKSKKSAIGLITVFLLALFGVSLFYKFFNVSSTVSNIGFWQEKEEYFWNNLARTWEPPFDTSGGSKAASPPGTLPITEIKNGGTDCPLQFVASGACYRLVKNNLWELTTDPDSMGLYTYLQSTVKDGVMENIFTIKDKNNIEVSRNKTVSVKITKEQVWQATSHMPPSPHR